MQRWALLLSGFNYKIEFIKGSINDADNLSRIPQLEYNDIHDEKSFIHLISKDNNLNLDFNDIARETRRDPILAKICDVVKLGTIKDLKGHDFKPYCIKENELTVDQGCLLWGYRVVIPHKLRKIVLQQLHESHFGVVKTKSIARSYVWWPNLDIDIENLVKNCIPCQELLPIPQKSPLIPWIPTEAVWSRIHIDFAGPIKGYFLLVCIDFHSKWVEIFKTKCITSNFVISKLREMFCRFGLVKTIVSDNGKQFVSDEFKYFLKINKIQHILTAPGHPATNGQVENLVKVLKKSLFANLRYENEAGIDIALNRFLIDYRNTKHCTTQESPAKLFLGRLLRTRFDLMKPPLIIEKMLRTQENSIRNYKGKRVTTFKVGQRVFIRDYRNPNKPSWSPAKIIDQFGPRTYQCELSHSNRVIKRHADQIRSGSEDKNQQSDVDAELSEVPAAQVENKNITDNNTVETELAECVERNVNDNNIPLEDLHQCYTNSSNDGQVNTRHLRPRIQGKVVKK
ncbi:uncharacterized protein K02A2.6-like [Teleopsis dalmanni]|uniref:uncharacterized protein K02A2.6-like n=1 Tax=Teleopsis dalmanni TaxID=139649 RepID=UPI0018CE216E|nr:uncharacterized protein K02A2.6-like [Teleopsis dalmanni]